ncbi:contractile injection system protein, VgrG/Pvc8 family [Sphingomonas melonis]|uniref:contractile injection system protein, VgrG/Pvc8 family n=1 Tax=Sphingomonas melonis TaxID=152682 RepID=UPI00036B40B6|nr:contractile injection system protein, VgrG/Pvc8 family [Sphingomonas melonis]
MNNIPDFRLTMGGTDLRGTLFDEALQLLDITDKVRPRLISIGLSEKRGGEADQLDIVLDDTDGALDLPVTGATLQLQIGWKAGSDVTVGLVDKGRFIVDEVSHAGPPDAITIKARAADFAGDGKTRRERTYHDTTLGAIVAQIAGRLHVKPRCASALASIPIATAAQSRESDLAFIRRIGREHDAVAKVASGALILSPIGAGTTASGKALPALTIRRRQGDAHQFTRQKRDDVPGVAATWHDRNAGKRQTFVAGKVDGAKKLARVYPTEEAAQHAANAAQAKAGREPVSLSLTLLGRPDIAPEQKATVIGYKTAIDAIGWIVSEVQHSIGDVGFTTKLSLEAA